MQRGVVEKVRIGIAGAYRQGSMYQGGFIWTARDIGQAESQPPEAQRQPYQQNGGE